MVEPTGAMNAYAIVSNNSPSVVYFVDVSTYRRRKPGGRRADAILGSCTNWP